MITSYRLINKSAVSLLHGPYSLSFQGITYPLSESCESVAVVLTSVIVLLVGFWRTAVYFIPCIILIYCLQILFHFMTRKCAMVQKPSLESLDKTAVEAVNNVLVVKILGIADIIIEKYNRNLKKLLWLVTSVLLIIYIYNYCYIGSSW